MAVKLLMPPTLHNPFLGLSHDAFVGVVDFSEEQATSGLRIRVCRLVSSCIRMISYPVSFSSIIQGLG
jgi:hypothetical protein